MSELSGLIDESMVREAFETVRPAIEAMFDHGETKRPTIYLVAAIREGHRASIIIGEGRETWSNDYEKIANAKLDICLRTGLDSRVVAFTQPWLLEPGDVKYGGGVNCGGVCVAASGNHWYHDQMFAEWVISAIQAKVRAKVELVLDDASAHYLPTKPVA